MKREKGTGAGFYLNRASGEFVHLDKIDALLLKRNGGQFIRVPAIGVIIGAPLISLAYVIFLPLAGLASLAVLPGIKLRNIPFAFGHKTTVNHGEVR